MKSGYSISVGVVRIWLVSSVYTEKQNHRINQMLVTNLFVSDIFELSPTPRIMFHGGA